MTVKAVANPLRLELFKSKGRQPWRLRLRAGNNEVVATSEGYLTKWNAKRAARRVFPTIELIELEA